LQAFIAIFTFKRLEYPYKPQDLNAPASDKPVAEGIKLLSEITSMVVELLFSVDEHLTLRLVEHCKHWEMAVKNINRLWKGVPRSLKDGAGPTTEWPIRMILTPQEFEEWNAWPLGNKCINFKQLIDVGLVKWANLQLCGSGGYDFDADKPIVVKEEAEPDPRRKTKGRGKRRMVDMEAKSDDGKPPLVSKKSKRKKGTVKALKKKK
jgi:hypothetical protein